MVDIKSNILTDLFEAFPCAFINSRAEFIAIEKTNLYFLLGNCETENDVKCKILEWFSRDATKAMPYRSTLKNMDYQNGVLCGINKALKTNFSHGDMEYIYTHLGNAIRHDATMAFVESNFDMEVLKREVRQ